MVSLASVIQKLAHAIYTEIFSAGIIENFIGKNSIFLMFLSHLLIAGSHRSPNLRSSVRTSVSQHLHRSFVYPTSEIAASVKPCIVIVLDIPFKHAP